MSGLGSQGDAADFMREVFFARRFFPLFFFFFFFFSKDERESSCRAVSAQADFVTHVLPSVT